MKRFFTLILTIVIVVVAQATDYTDKLEVLINGEGTIQEATISVTAHDGLYDLNLKNFVLMNGDSPMGVGNVELKNIVPEQSGDVIFLRANQMITVTDGDDPDVVFWLGPSLGELPVELVAAIEGTRLHASIKLDLMELLQQYIDVRFGTGYHIPNGGFEEWHTSSGNYVEPNAWHSFESATGTLASLAGNHIEKSAEGHNGSCARIFATSLWGVVANGTMTTGRMNAGSMSAANTENNAYIDISKTEVDGNGDPFYVPLYSCPDSLVVWVKFKQGTTNNSHPYATVSAVITDGTYYQDPEDKTYTNVVAKATDRQIAVTNGEWRRLSIPFVYTDNNVEPKAILVTISTNADPGQGSKDDEVLVDDIALVYKAGLASLNVDGFAPEKLDYEVADPTALDNLVAETGGKGAYILKTVGEDENYTFVTFTVYSADLSDNTVYTVKSNKNSQGIQTLSPSFATESIYTLNGLQVATVKPGGVYIVRRANGRIVKVRP